MRIGDYSPFDDEKFSQRTEKIEASAKESAINDAAAKDKLAALTREKKVKISMSDLKREWTDRLTPEEKQSSSRFQVYESQTLPLVPGDKIRITQNGFTSDGKHRLNN